MACSTAKVIDQALIIAVKLMVNFLTFLVVKLTNASVTFALTDLKSTVPTTSRDYVSLEWIQFRSYYVIFYFPSTSI